MSSPQFIRLGYCQGALMGMPKSKMFHIHVKRLKGRKGLFTSQVISDVPSSLSQNASQGPGMETSLSLSTTQKWFQGFILKSVGVCISFLVICINYEMS